MTINPATPVGDLVCQQFGRLDILEEFGIDYCCGGQRTLAEACSAADQPLAPVLAALAAADARAAADGRGPVRDWTQASLADLTDHIVATHHAFLKDELPRLAQLLEKVLQAHGPNHPELTEVGLVFRALAGELGEHLQKEEQVLFPLIRTMEASGMVATFHCGSVNAPISVMEREHDQAGEALRRLRALTGGYPPPQDACVTYRALLDGLAALERDLHEHIHLENNILHPRATRLEAGFAGARQQES